MCGLLLDLSLGALGGLVRGLVLGLLVLGLTRGRLARLESEQQSLPAHALSGRLAVLGGQVCPGGRLSGLGTALL